MDAKDVDQAFQAWWNIPATFDSDEHLSRMAFEAGFLAARPTTPEAQVAEGKAEPLARTGLHNVAAASDLNAFFALAGVWGLGQRRSSPWRPIAEAKKDGSIIWAILHDDIYPTILPRRDDLQRWNGVQVPLRHNGLAEDGFDIGWNVAAPVGSGGFPDEWIAGWRMLPSPPPSTKGAVE
jgi:hypothetical protein